MRSDLVAYRAHQVFLNYPFDEEFIPLSYAMHFAVVAAGLLPVCAKDLSAPDRPRLEMLLDAVVNCHFSAHDFSRYTGEGDNNFARFNMPIEMGMALFHALQTQRARHRCAFFVATPHDYRAFASDLGGLDPKCYNRDELLLVEGIYEWLGDTVREPIFNRQATIEVKEKYKYFKTKLGRVRGSGKDGEANHHEAQELMYQICADCGWWDWRANRAGRIEFPVLPILLREE